MTLLWVLILLLKTTGSTIVDTLSISKPILFIFDTENFTIKKTLKVKLSELSTSESKTITNFYSYE